MGVSPQGVGGLWGEYKASRPQKCRENEAAKKCVAKATRWSEFKAPGTWPRPPGGVNSKHQVCGQGHVRVNKSRENEAAKKYVALAIRWNELKAPSLWLRPRKRGNKS